ncbi:aldehyde dehydrogenase family protein [Botrimarina sp.]|uniref:aldehyde dehydrogenase family protein n=1 Tax=Botrimarina sp. TaxID=2795802 RepID=UPI0032F0105B
MPTMTQRELQPAAAEFLGSGVLRSVIDGAPHTGEAGAELDVLDPSTAQPIARIAMGGAAEVAAAAEAADRAFADWSALAPNERSVWLHRLADALEDDQAALAELESLDVGKAITAARGFDIPFGIECLRYFADLAVNTLYDVPLPLSRIEARTHRTPYGACGFILPWNFPFDLLMWGVAPALAAGNTVVVKPSEVTPLSALYVCHVAQRIGLPAGVINVVLGDGPSVGAPMPEHPLIRRMSFTGSTEVGKKIGAACGARPIPAKLELGGKGAAVVFDDVDLPQAAHSLADAITLNTGQVCCTATRWVVHEKVFDDFVDLARQRLAATKIGPGLDESTQMGPLVSQTQRDRVLGYYERGLAGGASALLERRPTDFDEGFFVSPVLLTGGVDNVCWREEIFGPAAFLTKFSDEAEAVATVNRLEYGLANSVWTSDLARAGRVAERMVAGNSWINAHNVFAYGLPYGGVNLSGVGGGVNSPETFFDYLRGQTIARPLG